jgi:hypothetical protein
MLRNYLTAAIRMLMRHRAQAAINVVARTNPVHALRYE